MILSLFCGCGGLDLGFEEAGFGTGLAYDVRPHSVASWNRNRPNNTCAKVADISKISIADLDADFGSRFAPTGVIGGPPCQSFSRANSSKKENDPRQRLVSRFFTLALKLHRERSPLDFIMMENVQELAGKQYGNIFKHQVSRLKKVGFNVRWEKLDAYDFGVPQNRKRLILVAYNKEKFGELEWNPPEKISKKTNVRDAIGGLIEPVQFESGLNPEDFPLHPNHWCMVPRSRKFFDGSLYEGVKFGRSFKTLTWNKPSFTVSYGHREVHVHPSGVRRLSIFEAMRLQSFPDQFVLEGTLSSQVTQVSEAVPPPLANAIAKSIKSDLKYKFSASHSKASIAEAA